MSGVSGQFGKLGALIRSLRRLDGLSIGEAIASRAAGEISTLALAAFDGQRSPYGAPWKPGKNGRALTLRGKTGALRAGLAMTPSGTRLFSRLVFYGKFYLNSRQQVLPHSKARSLPASWDAALTSTTADEIRRRLPVGR